MISDVLQVSPRGTRFLGRNPSLSRNLGREEESYGRFESGDSYDREAHEIGRFRGVYPRSPFYTKPLDQFRGLNDSSTLYRTPNNGYHKDDPSPGLLDKSHPLYGFNPEIRVTSENELSFNKINQVNPLDTAYAFPSSQVRQLLISSNDLNEAYTSGNSSRDYAQENELSAYAQNEIIPGIDKNRLQSEPDLARMILENRGGLREKLDEDKNLREVFDISQLEFLLDQSRQRVRDELSEELRNSGDILDEDFIEYYPLASLNLLKNPDLIRWVEEDRENAYQYKQDAGRTEKIVKDSLAEEAADEVQAFPYSTSFFEGNEELAEAVLSDRLTGYDHKLGSWLARQDSIRHDKSFAPDIAEKYLADTAIQETGGSRHLPEHLFENNPTLSIMVLMDSDLAEDLKNDSMAVRISYPDRNKLDNRTIAYRAFGLGLADRKYGEFIRYI